MESLDALEARLRTTIAMLKEAVQDGNRPLAEIAHTLNEIENELLQQETALADQDMDGLRQEWQSLVEQQQQTRDVLQQATALGLGQIQAQTRKVKKDLADLNALRLDKARRINMDKAKEQLTLKAEEVRQQDDAWRDAERRSQVYQQNLVDLKEEEKQLLQREREIGAALANLQVLQRQREWRTKCLDTAREICELRTSLRRLLEKSEEK